MKPSERIRELAEAGETHPFLIGNQARLDAIVAYLDERHAAAVPAGNQAKAPTALDEMRAVQEAAKCRNCGGSPGATELCLYCAHFRLAMQRDEMRAVQEATRSNACERGRCTPELTEMCGKHQDDYEASCVRNNLADGGTTSGYNPGAVAEKNPVIAAIDDYIEGLRAQLAESREALARVEAERDECQARNNELTDAFRRADAESRKLRKELDAAVTVRNTWRAMGASPLQAMTKEDHPMLHAALSALDQAASEAEVTERAPDASSYWVLERRDLAAPAYVAANSEGYHGWTTDTASALRFYTQHDADCHRRARGYDDLVTAAEHQDVSDPEATESATKGAT